MEGKEKMAVSDTMGHHPAKNSRIMKENWLQPKKNWKKR